MTEKDVHRPFRGQDMKRNNIVGMGQHLAPLSAMELDSQPYAAPEIPSAWALP